MKLRESCKVLFSALLVTLIPGCGKAGTSQIAKAETAQAPAPGTIARIHWVGRRKVDLDANGYYLSRIWSQPETLILQNHTFDKFGATAHQVLMGSPGPAIPVGAFRSVFDEFVLQESYFELRLPADSSTFQSCLAVHLEGSPAGHLVTNLAGITELLTGSPVSFDLASGDWTMLLTNPSRKIAASRLRDWVLFSIGPDNNPLLDEIAGRISRTGAPCPPASDDHWFEADLNPVLTARAFSLPWKIPPDISRVELKVTGDGRHVLTDCNVTFSNALPVQLEPWRVPAQLVHEPLLGFTAVRGVQPLLAHWKMWNDFQIGPPPGEFFFWSLSGTPFQTYIAAPGADAAHQVSIISDHLLQKGNPWLATNGYINFNRAQDSNGIVWGNMKAIQPFLKSADGFLYAGLLADPGPGTNAPMPAELLKNLDESNLVYYDWEKTGQLLAPRLNLTQAARQIARCPTMRENCASLNWLGTLIPRLGPSETTVTQTTPNELSFHRKSTLGFTAIELHLLADWLESATFPRGLHSLPASK